MILKDIPFPFSIVAKTKVILLEIKKQDMNKLQKDFLASLENGAYQRNHWLVNRTKDITKVSKILYK